MLLRSILVSFLSAAGVPAADGLSPQEGTPHGDDLQRAVVRGHAGLCHHLYRRSEETARAMEVAIAALLAEPGEGTLRAAREAWCAARRVYGLTETLRFCDGPIEAVEPLLNAWPVDEAYIDYVEGRADAGIINDPKGFPSLGDAVLALANERGGEANVSVGWHAIEFLLFGQDLDPDGCGARPWSDFADGLGRHAARRREYLRAATALLVRQLGELRAAWVESGAHRRAFEADPAGSVHKALTGVAVLTSFELNGERLGVALETRDQEQEHSCFSDTTCADLEANQRGIEAVLTGQLDGVRHGPGLLAVVERANPAAARELAARVAATLARFRAIPAPFDRAILGGDETPGRTAIRAAMRALDEQTDALLIAAHALGLDLPLKPGG
jgi:putative iron-regulated protein